MNMYDIIFNSGQPDVNFKDAIYGVAVGYRAMCAGYHTLALGHYARAYRPHSVAIGPSSHIKSEGAIGLGYSRYDGSGCVAFAMMASDAAFGDIPAYKFEDKSKIRVGDIIRINNDTHSVIVIKDNGGSKYTIAEGNYNSSVNYGRIIDLSKTGFTNGFTRYPKN